MKKLFISISFLSLALFSCSSENNDVTTPEQPKFAMTAKINGETFEANNPFGTNMFSSTNIWIYYPIEDFVMLQGRKGGIYGDPEINIWLKKTDIAVGTYEFGAKTFDTPLSHFIDLTDLTTLDFEYTKSGTISITSVNTTTKIVTGTFSFKSTAEVDPSAPVTETVTDGTFNYQYLE